MRKIMTLTESQFNDFNDINKRIRVIKEVLGVGKKVVNVGDTIIKVKDGKRLDVFKERETYYIIIEAIDEKISFAYSIY